MVNLEKIKYEKCQSLPPFKMTCPCTILPPPFFNFPDSPPPREVIKIYSPPFKKGGGSNYINDIFKTCTCSSKCKSCKCKSVVKVT